MDAPEAQRWEDRQVILERNLFGAQVVDAPAPPDPEPDEPMEETRLPLKLLGTIASDDQRVASAAIESNQTRQHEVVKVGDTLTAHAGVSVERIERGRVVLRNDGKREVLTLDEEALGRMASAPPPSSRRSARRSRVARSTVRDRLEELTQDGGPRSPAAIFSQARILPKYEDGSMVGIELSKIKPDSFYEKVGLQEGDIVTSLNGVPIDNPSASKQLLEAFTSADTLSAEVRRADGSMETITADADMLEQLGGMR